MYRLGMQGIPFSADKKHAYMTTITGAVFLPLFASLSALAQTNQPPTDARPASSNVPERGGWYARLISILFKVNGNLETIRISNSSMP